MCVLLHGWFDKITSRMKTWTFYYLKKKKKNACFGSFGSGPYKRTFLFIPVRDDFSSGLSLKNLSHTSRIANVIKSFSTYSILDGRFILLRHFSVDQSGGPTNQHSHSETHAGMMKNLMFKLNTKNKRNEAYCKNLLCLPSINKWKQSTLFLFD